MKRLRKTFLLSLSALALTTFNIQSAEAISVFNGSANISIDITGISNVTNPGSGYGNDINYSGSQADISFGSTITGAASVTPTLGFSGDPLSATLAVLPSTAIFSQNMLINGTASNGDIDSDYVSDTQITFTNTSTDTYTINYIVDYVLSSDATGENSEATMSFEGINLGLPGDYTEVYSHSAFSPFANDNNTTTLSLTLLSGQSASITSQLVFTGLAVATVPVPAAFWMFLSGLMVLPRLKKRI